MSIMTKFAFICMFFNTSLQIILFEANLGEQIPNLFATGKFTDFSAQWYQEIGVQIIETNIANIFLEPFVDFCKVQYRKYIVSKDKSGLKGNQATKCTSEKQYLDIHAGTECNIYEKYSLILNVVFTTMMLGPALPILFPIALITLVILYFSELYMLIYMDNMPPNYDETLNK